MRYSRIDSFFGLLKYFNAVLLVGLLVILWAGKTRPVEVTAECEHYRARFGIAPTYKFGLTEFHCEFSRRGFAGAIEEAACRAGHLIPLLDALDY